ncbi:MAG: hypothetical protein P4L64_01090 [Caulobacteraceae bacterium]|nr:hypothetical protein [Caulobacteraceae bacterium]
MSLTEPSNSNPPDPPLRRLLRLMGARPDQTISVAGPDALDLMISLCRAGYERVECARQATCAGADETSDLLILTGPAEALGGLAARTAPLLRDGGVLAAWLTSVEDDPPIRGALLVHGMEIITSALDIMGGLAVAHRVRRRGKLALVG